MQMDFTILSGNSVFFCGSDTLLFGTCEGSSYMYSFFLLFGKAETDIYGASKTERCGSGNPLCMFILNNKA